MKTKNIIIIIILAVIGILIYQKVVEVKPVVEPPVKPLIKPPAVPIVTPHDKTTPIDFQIKI